MGTLNHENKLQVDETNQKLKKLKSLKNLKKVFYQKL